MEHHGVWIWLLWVTVITLGKAYDADTSSKISTIWSSTLQSYDHAEPPRLDESTEVKIGLYMNNIHSIDSNKMEMSVEFYLRQEWIDPRFQFDVDGEVKKIRAMGTDIDTIWKPDIFFRNVRRANFRDAPSQQRLLTTSSDGTVWYVISISAVFSCPMYLHKYPFDTQRCPIMFESYGYTADTLYFAWLRSPVDIDPYLKLPQHRLVDKKLSNCTQSYTAGTFPCLEIILVFKRERAFYLCQYYLPSILIVILSWIGFWIRIQETTARLFPGILLLLILMIIFNMARAPLGSISYATAMDVWMLACFAMIFLTLVEFGVAYFLHKRVEEKDLNKRENKVSGGQDGKVSDKIDFFSRIVFPGAFLLFNIIYWSLYTS